MIALTSFLSAATLNQTLKRVVFSLPEGAEPIDASPVVVGDEPVAEGGPPENAEPGPDEAPPPEASPVASRRRLSKGDLVDPFVQRSIFDSTKVGATADGVAGGEVGASELRYVLIATMVAEPELFSSALIAKDDRESRSQGYGVGDTLEGGEGKIVRIEAKKVWIDRGTGELEYIEMGAKGEAKPRPAAEPEPSGEADGGITKEGDNKFIVERKLLEDAMANIDSLASKVRVVPHRGADGEVDGYRLSAIRRGSIFDKLGIKNGDIVHTVNGEKVTNVPQAFAAYMKVRKADTIKVELTRKDGSQRTLIYTLK
jgi:general secretion pathway protein C